MSTNTFCRELCYNDHTTYAKRRKEEIMKSLLYIKENLPRTLVNLIITLGKYNYILRIIYFDKLYVLIPNQS